MNSRIDAAGRVHQFPLFCLKLGLIRRTTRFVCSALLESWLGSGIEFGCVPVHDDHRLTICATDILEPWTWRIGPIARQIRMAVGCARRRFCCGFLYSGRSLLGILLPSRRKSGANQAHEQGGDHVGFHSIPPLRSEISKSIVINFVFPVALYARVIGFAMLACRA